MLRSYFMKREHKVGLNNPEKRNQPKLQPNGMNETNVCISDFLTAWGSVHQNLAVYQLCNIFPVFSGTTKVSYRIHENLQNTFVCNRNVLLKLKISSSFLYFLNSPWTFGGRNVSGRILLKLILLRTRMID